ncbi:MAG: 2'-5' RNA ligase [Rubrivivax sp.]|nr:MAG: 2'-5' RNA ligase [Rubrivivax sp.]
MVKPAFSEQPSLDGFDAPARPQDRLFFALYPAPEVAARADALRRALQARHGLSGKPVHQDRLHVTLNHVGDFAGLPQGLLADARQAAEALAPLQQAFDIGFDRVSSFRGRADSQPMILLGEQGVGAVTAFQARLDLALRTAGVIRRREPFTPHMTLSYEPRQLPPEPVEPIAWEAHEFVLVHSLIGQGRHEVLARWPLPARVA